MTKQPRLRWGEPPLALIPRTLGERLTGIPLPPWLAERFDGPGTSVAVLDADAWDRLPPDDAARARILTHVLHLVAARALELRDARIGPDEAQSVPELVSGWPTRARNALQRSGVGRDPKRLASLTFGELLDGPQIGVKTALETAALLEACGASRATSTAALSSWPSVPRSVPRWGEPGSPLLPETLRRALADEVLPAWLLRDLRLADDATPLSLDASAWRRLQLLPPRAERFLIGLVTYRAPDVRDVRVLPASWPSDISPREVPWPTRVYNSLVRAELLDAAQLTSVTYGDLLAIPAMGVKSVLEFAAIVDSVAAPAPAGILNEATCRELISMAEQDWAQRLRADDPRFRDVVPAYSGLLSDLFEGALTDPQDRRSHSIADAAPMIRARAEEIAAEPIDRALVRLLESHGAGERNVALLVARLGWGGDGPRTLQQVGDQFGMSRERVRQIERRVTERIGPTYLPQIERAVALLTERAPLRPEAAAQLLVEEHLSTVPFHPKGLGAAAKIVGYDVTFRIDPGDGHAFVLALGATGTGRVFAVARRQAGRVGVSNIDEVRAELEGDGEQCDGDTVSRMLRSSAKLEFLHEDWFWVPDISADRNRLRNVTQRMLSVTARLDIPTLRQGVRRRYRFMGIDLVPPLDVLAAFYAAHPEFVIQEDGTVESAIKLDYREALGDVDRIFVDVLRASPTGLMDRAELGGAVTARGMNLNTFTVFTTYSAILDHPATNVWCLRGHVPDPGQLEALRAVLATRTRQRRTIAYGWDEDGRIRLTVVVGTIGSPVIGIPAAIAHYVADRRFGAETRDGSPAGTIVVDLAGTSWGYGPFLRRRGAEPGDALTMLFDIVTETVVLSLDDGSELIDEAG